MSPVSPTAVNIIDTLALYRVVTYHAEQGRPVTVAYRELCSLLATFRRNHGFRNADATIAVVSQNPDNSGQARFVDALDKLEISVVPISFWNAYVSVPGQAERAEVGIQTAASTLAYLLGLLGGRVNPEVVLVTSIFDLYHPLLDFTDTRGGRVILSFFRRNLDMRWGQAIDLSPKDDDDGDDGDSDSSLAFEDLEPFSKPLLGIEARPGHRTGKGLGVI
jgi:hypothetical protein